MTNEQEKKILARADYYLSHQDSTMKDTANHFSISIKTLQLNFKKLESISHEKYILVEKKKNEAQNRGRVNGGKKGKRGIAISSEKLKSIIMDLISNQMSYKELSEKYHIPTSTLWELLHHKEVEKIEYDGDLVSDINLVAYANCHQVLIEDVKQENEHNRIINK